MSQIFLFNLLEFKTDLSSQFNQAFRCSDLSYFLSKTRFMLKKKYFSNQLRLKFIYLETARDFKVEP